MDRSERLIKFGVSWFFAKSVLARSIFTFFEGIVFVIEKRSIGSAFFIITFESQ